MDDFERSVDLFAGSTRIPPGEIVKLVADALDPITYTRVLASPRAEPTRTAHREHGPMATYDTDEHYWRDAIAGRHYEGMQLRLAGFYLTEWIPASPGRFFTFDAGQARMEAKKYVTAYRHGQELLPLGKTQMILGGVGSLRLRSRPIDGTRMYFLGASSSGISHQGVPVAVPENLFDQVSSMIKARGGCKVAVDGRLRVFTPDESPVRYYGKIPRYCLLASSLRSLHTPVRHGDLLTSVATGTGAVAALGLEGFVLRAAIEEHSELWELVETTATVVGCPGCGTRARSKGRVTTEVRDMACGGRPVRLVRRTRR